MAAKSKLPFNYVAHVQKDNGSVVELCGTHEEYNMRNVYLWLVQKAQDLGGWLLADNITYAEDGEAVSSSVSRSTYNEETIEPESEDEDTSPRIGANGAWGVYTKRYAGASRLTFKEGQ